MDTLQPDKADTRRMTPDSTKSSAVAENRIGANDYDDPSKPNIIIDDFSSLVQYSQKTSLPVNLSSTLLAGDDTTHEFFATRSFLEKYLNKKPLFNLLQPREDRLTWAGCDDEIYIPDKDYYPVPEAREVIEVGLVKQWVHRDSIFAFSFSEQFRPYLVFFEKSGTYLDGFQSYYHSGNPHGAFHIATSIDENMNFYVTIEDWADVINPNGHTINTTLRIEQKKLKRTAYRTVKQK